ncbi:MAG TPA: FadR family transcriptional regulator [Clostridia bacterium]|nr:FadR family transcriptional regulator [Clostridia bacterium]
MKFQFEQVKKVRVYEEIVEQLKRYFEQGNLKPGERLPSERDLAEMFNCSRVSVRQALTILEAQGLVVRKVGGGTYKADEDDFELSQLVSLLMPEREEDAIDDPLEVRRLMEPQIARLAAVRATEEDIALMEDCLRLQKEKVERGQLIIHEDSQFHYAIARATKNGIIIRLGEAINDMIWETRQQSIMAEQGAKRSLEGHYLIFEAIKNKDGEGASKAMEEHLREVESLMFAFNHKIEEA